MTAGSSGLRTSSATPVCTARWFSVAGIANAATSASGAGRAGIVTYRGHRSIATTMRYLHAQPETGSGSFLDLG